VESALRPRAKGKNFLQFLLGTWQLGTVQVDYNLPERFELEYIASNGSRERPVMIHRALFGSLERLIGILLEETSGHLPFWLSPIQVKILPISSDFIPFAENVLKQMQSLGIRAEVDTSGDRLNKLIHNAETQKIPVIAVIGKKEIKNNSLNLRTCHGNLEELPIEVALKKIEKANHAQD
jgi:threonyl-tRNA synthetase